MLKNKIQRIIFYWLCGLLAVVVIQVSAAAIFSPDFPDNRQDSSQNSQPMVLGAVSIRGQDSGLKLFPVKIAEFSPGNVSAKSYLVYDPETNQILAEKNSDKKYPIASLTKLLTALVAYKNVDLNQSFTISSADRMEVSPVLNLRTGDKVKGWDLFNSMLVGSSNDAALALSHIVSKDTEKDFVALMNEEAKSLAMTGSNFSNPLGFDSINNYSTAQDLKKLTDRISQYTAFTGLGKKVSYGFESQEGNKYKITASNKLVGEYPEIEAVKTGYTENSLGSMITKITKDNHKIVVIVLGSANREKDTLELEKQVFGSYEWKESN